MLCEEPPCDSSIDQQLDPVFQTQLGHSTTGTLVEEGETHLIGDNLDPTVHNDSQVSGIEIGQTQMANEPLLLEFLQPKQAIQPVRIRIIPGMEL